MATSFSPQPSFHLCPDFSIAPPPNGHLELGTVLRGLDYDSVYSPLNIGDTIKLLPLDKPSEKSGFSRSLRELRGIEGSIWANIFGSEGLGAAFSFLRNRENDEVLTVEKLFVRYFIPTSEYMKNALEIDGVAFYINDTKLKKPVYMITGLMWTEGARLSKVQSKKNRVSSQVAATEPNSDITSGVTGTYESEEGLATSFNGSTPFILGIRVRKIWWDKDNMRRDTEGIVGTTLGDSNSKYNDILDGIRFIDDELDSSMEQTIMNMNEASGGHPVA
ncbi:hypothetical protein COL516b_001554 [Colletotrichum fioriniae]|nr:uncharacterized protein COL516b_001554 [Colletotrichum fioriniae]KAJ0312470.1 hypothetical protein COL516b_001554 [Colletotrichum fioriniae]